LTSKISRKEPTALKSLKEKKEIRILQGDKGNCMVLLNESIYKEKVSSLLESWVYELLCKDPKFQTERKIRKLLTKHKTVLPLALKHKLTFPLDQGLALLALPVMPWQFLHNILSPLVG
jgi:hypothetical protein